MGWPFWGIGGNGSGWMSVNVWRRYRFEDCSDPFRAIAYYDGWWLHNTNPDRVYGRHFDDGTNLLLFDGTVKHQQRGVIAASLWTHSGNTGEVIWRAWRGW